MMLYDVVRGRGWGPVSRVANIGGGVIVLRVAAIGEVIEFCRVPTPISVPLPYIMVAPYFKYYK